MGGCQFAEHRPNTPLSPNDAQRDYPPEEKRDVKGWLTDRMPGKYCETVHQAEFNRHLDPELAAESQQVIEQIF